MKDVKIINPEPGFPSKEYLKKSFDLVITELKEKEEIIFPKDILTVMQEFFLLGAKAVELFINQNKGK